MGSKKHKQKSEPSGQAYLDASTSSLQLLSERIVALGQLIETGQKKNEDSLMQKLKDIWGTVEKAISGFTTNIESMQLCMVGLTELVKKHDEQLKKEDEKAARIEALEGLVGELQASVSRLSSHDEASTSGRLSKQNVTTSICVFGVHTTQSNNHSCALQGLVDKVQNIMGREATIQSAMMLGSPKAANVGGWYIGAKLRLATQSDVQVALSMRRDIELATGGHLVEDMTREEIEIRRRRVGIMRMLRAAGFWAKIDGLHLLVKDPCTTTWRLLCEDEAMKKLGKMG